MTIQMIATWGGYEQYSVQNLTSQEESRLVALGIARPFTAGQDTSFSGDAFLYKVALGVMGQSNEAGSTLVQDALGVWQRFSAAAPSQGIYEPVKLQNAGSGSMFTAVAELLAADKIKVDLHNGAVGSTSLYVDWAGFVFMGGRANSTPYRGKRASLGAGDPGTRGDLVYVNGATWEATTGNKHLVFWSDPSSSVTVNGVQYFADPGVVVKETNLVTASSPPAFPGSPAVGNTVVDGAITWTCIHVGARVAEANNVRVCRASDDGFDPYFMCARLRSSLMTSPVSATKRYVYIQNGQSDAGVATAIYTMALRMLGQFFGQPPYYIQPIFGLSIYAPGQGQAGWDLLETSLSNGGLGTTADFNSSPVTAGLLSTGYHLAVPGQAITNFGFYYGQSLYRALGLSVDALLQPDQRHTLVEGMNACAKALAPTLSKILRNSAS